MEDNNAKAYTEVLEILKYVPKEEVDKIPKIMFETFEKKRDKNYSFKIDINKSFEEQELLKDTDAILAIIFRDYWATPYQKERIEDKQAYDRQKLEEEKRKKYNPDNLFKNNNKTEIIENIENYDNNLPIEIKKNNFFKNIIEFFKKIFKVS